MSCSEMIYGFYKYIHWSYAIATNSTVKRIDQTFVDATIPVILSLK